MRSPPAPGAKLIEKWLTQAVDFHRRLPRAQEDRLQPWNAAIERALDLLRGKLETTRAMSADAERARSSAARARQSSDRRRSRRRMKEKNRVGGSRRGSSPSVFGGGYQVYGGGMQRALPMAQGSARRLGAQWWRERMAALAHWPWRFGAKPLVRLAITAVAHAIIAAQIWGWRARGLFQQRNRPPPGEESEGGRVREARIDESFTFSRSYNPQLYPDPPS